MTGERAREERSRDGQATGAADETRGRAAGKSVSAFRTISEVSSELDVPQHVLRFWESKFTQLRPLKRGGGRRYYRPEDVTLLRRIHGLLYREGYTIKGVQRVLRTPRKIEGDEASPEIRPATAEAAALPVAVPAAPRPDRNRDELLRSILAELKMVRAMLD